ncbi:MAG: uroporphyrinogen-III C-methyltransferase [Cyclobacteriaceae bacterium]|nr:uroporphyrinogen-III C-methyltransferase [Cyclobacteriaceae bacterium]
MIMKDKLTLVGGGPGKPDLITVRGTRVLGQADVILYDALINKELLQYTRPKAIRINVGKRRGDHAYSQDEINKLIVFFAKKGKHVVRLKGGDPFVFGRGMEELEYANAHGITTAVVPGISSAIAVPGSVGIPVTQRGVNRGFAVITATSSRGELSADLLELVKTSIPVVILMGIHKIDQIMALYQAQGKTDIPVAVISNGTGPDEKTVTGTTGDLLSTYSKGELDSPGIIVIGEIVSSFHKLRGQLGHENIQSAGYEY